MMPMPQHVASSGGLVPPTTPPVHIGLGFKLIRNQKECPCPDCHMARTTVPRWMLKEAVHVRTRVNRGLLLVANEWRMLPSIEHMRTVRIADTVHELFCAMNYIKERKDVESLQHAVDLVRELDMLGYAAEVFKKGRIVGAHDTAVLPNAPVKVPQLVTEKPIDPCPLCKGIGFKGEPPIERWTCIEDLHQVAPTLSLAAREYLVLHSCKACWNSMFPPDPDDTMYKWS